MLHTSFCREPSNETSAVDFTGEGDQKAQNEYLKFALWAMSAKSQFGAHVQMLNGGKSKCCEAEVGATASKERAELRIAAAESVDSADSADSCANERAIERTCRDLALFCSRLRA